MGSSQHPMGVVLPKYSGYIYIYISSIGVALIKLCVEHVGGRLFQLLTTLELGCIWKLSTMLQPLCSCGGYYAQGRLNSLFDGPGCCVSCKSFSFECWNYGNMSSEFRAFCGKQGFSSLETGSQRARQCRR